MKLQIQMYFRRKHASSCNWVVTGLDEHNPIHTDYAFNIKSNFSAGRRVAASVCRRFK